MSTKAIYEATGKKILNKYLNSTAVECRCVSIDDDTDWNDVIAKNAWLQTEVKFSINLFRKLIRFFLLILAFGC